MKSLFFYGTLRHVPLLEIVLGRSGADLMVQEATLADHAVFWAKDQAFPMIVKGQGTAKGLLVSGLSDNDIERLNFYEGGFDYDLQPVNVMVAGDTGKNGVQTGAKTAVQTQVFFPDPDTWATGAPWDLADWTSRWGEMTEYAANEVMGYFGTYSAENVARMFPMIRARATAKVMARANNKAVSPSDFNQSDVSVHNVTRPYLDFFAIDEYDVSFRRYEGGQSEMVRRAVFIATDAVIVLPYDPVRDCVLLIEQFRPGPFARGDNLPWQLEPIAGRVDAGESPQDTAHREAKEEAGLELNALHDVAHCYASPGCSTEYYNIYIGLADLPKTAVGVAGLDSEAEDIRSYLFSFDELMALVDDMKAVNAPLVLAALWLARHRERLRGDA